MKIKENIKEISEEIAKELGYEIVEVNIYYGKKKIIRIAIDKIPAITVEDCERFSNFLSVKLDNLKLFSSPYYLEVCSPGPRRPLFSARDYSRFIGEKIKLITFTPVENKKFFKGTLVDFQNEFIYIKEDSGRIYQIFRENIKKANLNR